MKLLMVGDVVSSNGTRFLREKLPSLKRALGIDITVVNGENSADGNGITPFSAEEIFSAGADVITGGNHTLRRREIYDMCFVPQICPRRCPAGAFASWIWAKHV